MAVEIRQENDGKVLVIGLSGRLTKEDYSRLVPEVDKSIEKNGHIRMLIEMHDFHGWSCAALWEDTKFAVRHFRDIERLAVVGERKWQRGMTAFCRPFTKAEIRYFDRSHTAEASAWVAEEPVAAK